MKKYYLTLGILFFLSTILSGQDQNLPLFDLQNKKYENSFEKFYQTKSITRTIVPQVLEAELEADLYIVGPGDQFRINVYGELDEEFDITVLPEGTVQIPGIGEMEVSGKDLRTVKKQLKSKVSESYIKADVKVNLTGLRKFRVYLTGEVDNPGTYFAQGSDRLSDVIEVSADAVESVNRQKKETTFKGLNDWADDTAINIKRLDGSKIVLDLSRFYRNGDKSQNPYLRGGDMIYVPSIDLEESYVFIEGNFGYQGIYPFKFGETLIEFLHRVSAFSRRSNLESVILERGSDRFKINLLQEHEKYSNFKLQEKDKIIIPELYNQVYVRGEVFSPGALPYMANYLAKDYIGRAGALDTGVGEDGIIVIRQETGEIFKGGNVLVEKGDTVILPKRGREIFKDYMTIAAPILSLFISTAVLFTTR